MDNSDGYLRTLGNALHQRLLSERSDSVIAEIAEFVLPPLVRRLKWRFPKLSDPHQADTVAIDSVIAYLNHPEKFDPNRGSLLGYLFMDACGDLLNALKREKRYAEIYRLAPEVELTAVAGTEDPEGHLLERESPLVRQVAEVLSPSDAQLVALMMERVRETAAYAEVLGIGDRPRREQALLVKRHKDRVKVALRRIFATARNFVVAAGLIGLLTKLAKAASRRPALTAASLGTIFVAAIVLLRSAPATSPASSGPADQPAEIKLEKNTLLAANLERLRQGVAEGWALEKIVFVRGVAPDARIRHIWMINPDGTGAEQVTYGDVNDIYPVVSPDGTKLAFSRSVAPVDAGHGDCRGIWVRDLLTGIETSITASTDFPAGPYSSASPAWSPDGKRIAFHRNLVNNDCQGADPGRASIWVVNYPPPAGTPIEVTRSPVALSPWWSPDGGHLVFMREMGQDGMYALYRVDPETGIEDEVLPYIPRPVPGHHSAEHCPEYSPDGTRIAWTSYRHSRRGDIYVADGLDPLKAQLRVTEPSTLHWSSPSWSPDGNSLVFYSATEKTEGPDPAGAGVTQHLWISKADGTGLRQLTSGTDLDIQPSWAFVALPHADLFITASGRPGASSLGSKIAVTFTVTNNGPSAAEQVKVTASPSPVLRLLRSQASGGGLIENLDESISARFAILRAGQKVTLRIVVRVERPESGLAAGVTAAVSSATVDRDKTNNLAVAQEPMNTGR